MMLLNQNIPLPDPVALWGFANQLILCLLDSSHTIRKFLIESMNIISFTILNQQSHFDFYNKSRNINTHIWISFLLVCLDFKILFLKIMHTKFWIKQEIRWHLNTWFNILKRTMQLISYIMTLFYKDPHFYNVSIFNNQ